MPETLLNAFYILSILSFIKIKKQRLKEVCHLHQSQKVVRGRFGIQYRLT
jgi:hypothetical protein